ncbi:uncharacterized protein LOC141821686 [Curcuma longa]|uniref:uncharacterized protein LOC141821686 n=1 Tax=Curcuma longa TaxID=136217 RepID=UPI003D9E0CF5
MGKKRSKSSIDENQENITKRRISRVESNTSPNSSEDLYDKEQNDDNNFKKKKGRGPTKLKLATAQQKAKELERNEFGQPVGINSVKYASFLGCIVQEFVPYTLDEWNDVHEDVKNKMWSVLQVNYKVEEWEKKAIFKKLAKLWRDRKSKLQILVREANAGKVATRNLDLLKPEFMDQQEWKLFIKRTLSPEFQAKSAKYREMRSNQDHIHTMSRRGYARLASMMEETNTTDTPITRSKVWIEGHKKKNGQPSSQAVGEKLKKLEECPPESLNTTNMAEDAISLVFGKEPRGRVRGMGFGITPSKVGASMQQKATVKDLECKVHNLQMQMDEMRSLFFKNMRQQDEEEQVNSGGIGSGIGIDVGGHSANNGKIFHAMNSMLKV